MENKNKQKMKTEEIPFEEIQEIAQDVIGDRGSIELPTLEEISWAFPVGGRERVYYYRDGYMDRIPNTQEGSALSEIMTFKNFSNILDFFTEGVTSLSGCLPIHTLSVGDAEDGAYMVYPYLAKREKKEGEEGTSYYWDNISSDLVDAVIRVEDTGRGKLLDSSGEIIEKLGNNAYVDSDLTRQYLENLRDAVNVGKKYFNSIRDLSSRSKDYSQLVVEENPESWRQGDGFELAHGSRKEPGVDRGEVLLNNGKSLDLKAGEDNIWRGVDTSLLKEYGENNMLWKLVPGKVK